MTPGPLDKWIMWWVFLHIQPTVWFWTGRSVCCCHCWKQKCVHLRLSVWPCDVNLKSANAVNPWEEDELENKCFVRCTEQCRMPLSLFSVFFFPVRKGSADEWHPALLFFYSQLCYAPLNPNLSQSHSTSNVLFFLIVSLALFLQHSCISALTFTKKTRMAFMKL